MINNIIEIIAESGNRGKELMVDSFILGIAWGRKIINKIEEIKQAAQFLYYLNMDIELNTKSPFYKLDLFQQFLEEEENCRLFQQVEANFKQSLKEEMRQKEQITEKKQVAVNKLGLCKSLCGICQFYINDLDEEKCTVPQCGHVFHNLCLYEQIDQQGLKQCYTCQIQLDPTIKTQIFKKISIAFKSICPNPGCNEEFIYFGKQNFNCDKCNFGFCLKCKQIEHNDQCIIGIDKIDMKQGQKFKFCFKCYQTIEQNFQDYNSHQCKTQESNKPNSLTIYTVFRSKKNI